MRPSMPLLASAGLLIALFALPAIPEILRLPGQPPRVLQAERQPARGMAQDRVLALLGEPARRHAAVGDPPIARWDYPGFSVYFEHGHVIHTVVGTH
jgi:hypothetical protein